MQKWVAFLRGINVGGHRKVPMADLRRCVGDRLGAADVRSYIASGNLVFRADGSADGLSAALGGVIQAQFGLEVPVRVLSEADMRGILKSCPFPLDAGKAVHGFLCFGTPRLDQKAIAQFKAPGEDLRVTGETVWLSAPDGIGRSKLAARLDFGVPATARNLNTLRAMVAMLDDLG